MYKVLIVEDEDIIRKGIAYTMDWMGMGCVIAGEAADGLEGLEKIRELQPDIVVADIMMPEMNGIEMLRQAREEGHHFKSILLTSYADFEYAQQAIRIKVSEYLMKPVDEKELRAVVARITEELKREGEMTKIVERHAEEYAVEDLQKIAGDDNPYVQKVMEITEQEYSDKISIESIAERLGVSASYLARKFKAATDMTYLDFLNKYRISQAVQLLETGQYKIYEISDMTGFSDYKHFNTVFKRYTGKSPSEFTR